MKKDIGGKAAWAAVLLLFGVLQAAGQVRFGGGVHGGLTFASFTEGVKDFYGSGFNFGANANLDFSRAFGIRLNVDYNVFPSDKSKYGSAVARHITVGGVRADPAALTFDGANIRIIALSVDALGRLPVSRSFAPYAVAGLGMNFLSTGDPSVSYRGIGDITPDLLRLGVLVVPESQSNFAINSGVGADLRVGIVILSLEARYVLMIAKGGNSSYFPVTLGVRI